MRNYSTSVMSSASHMPTSSGTRSMNAVSWSSAVESANAELTADPPDHSSVVTIGVFDGVHRGHQALVGHARSLADRAGLDVVAMTFEPNPASVVEGRQAPAALTTLADRVLLLEQAGADRVIVLSFDRALAATEPEAFVREIVMQRARPRAIVVGENFRFGHRAAGDVGLLRDIGLRAGYEVHAVPLQADQQPWSSTRVRQDLTAGAVEAAAAILGRPYRLRGTVVHGDHRGRELGYPTANLAWAEHFAVPADGVYAGWITVGEAFADRLPAAISVGTNPQFAGQDRRVEAHVIDRTDLDLYGLPAAVDFVARLRGQMTFGSVDGLVQQMAQDVDAARGLLVP